MSYLVKFKLATIRIRTEESEVSSKPTTPCDWEGSFYGKVKELTPHDAPTPLEKHVVTISYHNANLFYNVIVGRSVAGALHMLNKTPTDWFSKKKHAIEILTCASE